MTYQEIKSFINTYIVQNGVNAITGSKLNTALNALADNYVFDAVTVETLPAGTDATVNIEGRTLHLGIPRGVDGIDGQNAVNPFKGWYTTDNIPTEGQAGDYCNVSNTSVTPHTVTIYRWSTSLNRFVDTGEVPDTATGDTFASSETLQEVAIDDSHLVNPVNTADATKPVLAQAADVMQLKAKLEGVTASETNVPLTQNTNWFDGKYLAKTGQFQNSNGTPPNGVLIINVEGYKKIRFLGYYSQSSSAAGYGFSSTLPDPTNTTDIQIEDVYEFDFGAQTNQAKEYIIDIPEDKPYFACTIRRLNNTYMTLDNFYCYLQSGTSVGEELADKASYSDMEGLWMWKKNLLDKDNFGKGYFYAYINSSWIQESTYGIVSQPLHLIKGVTYTASKVLLQTPNSTPQVGDENGMFRIAYYNANNELITVKTKNNGKIEFVSSAPGGSVVRSYGTVTFVYDEENIQQEVAYVRINLQGNIPFYKSDEAQLEVGEVVTELAPYNSEKVFDIAKKSEVEQSLSELEQKHDTDIENINNKFKYSDYVEIGSDGYYTVEGKYLRYLVSSGSMEKTTSLALYPDLTAQRYKLYPVEEGVDYYFTGSINTNINYPEYPIIFLSGTTDIETGYSGSLNKEDALGVGFGTKGGRINANALWEKDKAKLTIPEGCNTIAINIWDKATKSLSPFILYKYVEGEYDLEDLNDKIENKEEKQTLNVLVLGHSNAQETMAYVPYLFRNLEISKNIDVNFGILYLGSSGIANHINNFDYMDTPYDENNPSGTHQESNTGVVISSDYVTMKNNGTSYTYSRFFVNDEDWVNGSNYSIQHVLRRNKWDIILMPANEYAAQTHILMKYIIDYISVNHQDEDENAVEPYTVKFGAINYAAMVVKSNGSQWTGPSDETHGVPYPEAEDPNNPAQGTLQYRWKVGVEGGADVLDRTLYEFIIPAYAAICNALTVDEIKKFGDYAYHVNNTNYIDNEDPSDGCYGYLRAPDGVHLQEGLPCQIVAYAVICKLLEILEMDYKGILGDTLICNADWIEDKSIPGYNPHENCGPSYAKKYTTKDILAKDVTGWSDDYNVNLQRAFFAQKCAIMAVKKPFEITDMNNFYGEKHPIMFYAPHASRDNIVSIIDDGKPYSTEITANSGYTLSSVSVKMNNVDIITNTVYNSSTHTITIGSVTGKVQILVSVTKSSN